jgi:hypothetical protein
MVAFLAACRDYFTAVQSVSVKKHKDDFMERQIV